MITLTYAQHHSDWVKLYGKTPFLHHSLAHTKCPGHWDAQDSLEIFVAFRPYKTRAQRSRQTRIATTMRHRPRRYRNEILHLRETRTNPAHFYTPQSCPNHHTLHDPADRCRSGKTHDRRVLRLALCWCWCGFPAPLIFLSCRLNGETVDFPPHDLFLSHDRSQR